MEDFLKMVNACEDIQAVKNVVCLLVDGMETGMNALARFETLKEACGELTGRHYTEDIARLYYSAKRIDGTVWDAAKQAYTPEIQASYPDVPLADWLVFGRMSQNTKGNNAIVEACKMYLNNNFAPWSIN